ncbi:homoserine kinase [Cumulibacter manganitolerans]|uniref:homoserine kinase n=1 Tax=Cumulibacter manganitolerans TaxID=1884992 RepID=UPI001296CEAA|nr:homoserine kinase [Cumulibacter manganitolerans]
MTRAGAKVTARIPATTANLGPGFDCMGLSLAIYDTVSVEAAAGERDEVVIEGIGADTLPRDGTHMVLATMRELFALEGWQVPPVRLSCHNRIRHGQGLGSSASAIVAGLLTGKAYAETLGYDVHDVDLVQIGSDIDGHPDNVAPCLNGGLNVSWEDADGWGVAHLDPHPDIRAILAIPTTVLSTKVARGLIPEMVSHRDAVRNSSRAALCIHAFTTDPALLLPATQDYLHQRYRASAYPDSYALVERMRAVGIAAAISGAGPAVIMFVTGEEHDAVVATEVAAARGGFELMPVGIDLGGAVLL